MKAYRAFTVRAPRRSPKLFLGCLDPCGPSRVVGASDRARDATARSPPAAGPAPFPHSPPVGADGRDLERDCPGRPQLSPANDGESRPQAVKALGNLHNRAPFVLDQPDRLSFELRVVPANLLRFHAHLLHQFSGIWGVHKSGASPKAEVSRSVQS